MTNTEIKQEISNLMDKYNEKIKQENKDFNCCSFGESMLIENRIKVYEEFNKDLMKLLLSV